jgi:hypothetical protein
MCLVGTWASEFDRLFGLPGSFGCIDAVIYGWTASV